MSKEEDDQGVVKRLGVKDKRWVSCVFVDRMGRKGVTRSNDVLSVE